MTRGCGRAVGGQAHELVDHLSAGLVPLAHAHEHAAVRRDASVGVAVGACRGRLGREGARRAPGGRPQVLPVQPLVRLVAEDDALAAVLRAEGDVHAAAVLVHERARAHARGRDVGDLAVRRPSDDHVTAVLQRAQFHPVQALAHTLRPHDAHAAFSDELRGDGRAPGTVGCDGGARGGHAGRAGCISAFLCHRLPHTLTGGGAAGVASRRASGVARAAGVSHRRAHISGARGGVLHSGRAARGHKTRGGGSGLSHIRARTPSAHGPPLPRRRGHAPPVR